MYVGLHVKYRLFLTFYVLLTMHLCLVLINYQLDAQFPFLYVYSNSLHVSSTPVLIIRRINCINTTSGICHSMQVIVQCANMQVCTLNGHLHTVIYTRCRIDTIDSPDDEHSGARNMQRIGINIYKKGTVRQVGYLLELKKKKKHFDD